MAEQFSEKVEVLDSASNVTILLNGNAGALVAGGNGQDGSLNIRDSAGNERIWVDGQRGNILIKNADGKFILRIDGNRGDIVFHDEAGRNVFAFNSAYANLLIGANGNDGGLSIRDGSGRIVFGVNSANANLYIGANGNGGDLNIRDGSGQTVFTFNSANPVALSIRDGSGRQVFGFNRDTAGLCIGANGKEGYLQINDGSGRPVLVFNGTLANLFIGAHGNDGNLFIRDGSGRMVFNFFSDGATLYIGANGNEGNIIVRDEAGNERIRLDGHTGDIKLQGADCAEEFDVARSEDIDPGTVLVIDEQSRLRPCNASYDKKVAGVVSGGNGSNPGIILDKNPTENKRLPIALNGKVYCKVDAQYSSIEVGDLLTTSSTPGHAMKADDPLKAFGAVIGKALHPLKKGKELIPILVALQ